MQMGKIDIAAIEMARRLMLIDRSFLSAVTGCSVSSGSESA